MTFVCIAAATTVPFATAVAAQSAPIEHGDGAAEEQQFVEKINALRASLGLAQLAVDPELTNQARAWSATMNGAGNIFHAEDLSVGITSDWHKLGENVGVGGTVDALFDAFVASPKHYENLVDPGYRFIGVGVAWDGDRMFTAHRFMSVFDPVAPAPPATPKPAKQVAKPSPPSTAGAPVPRELAAADPTTATTAPPPPAAPPPAPSTAIDPTRLALELDAFRAFLS